MTEDQKLELYAKVKEAFESNPDMEVCYVTTDGQCFQKNNLAELHARSQADGSIARALRDDALNDNLNLFVPVDYTEVFPEEETTEEPAAEVVTEAPVIEEPAAEVVTEAPVVEEPAAEVVTEAPVVEEPAAEVAPEVAPEVPVAKPNTKAPKK